jgi:hypothetical protein
MPPPQKVYKAINHDDTHYRWIMQNRSGFNELVVELSAAVNGQPLVAELPRVVNHHMVTDAIDYGRANGWVPELAGAPFRCKFIRKKAFVRTGEAGS